MREDISKAKAFYGKIRALKSPALSNDEIAFTRLGFNHLIRKNKRVRSPEEQNERFALLKYAESILTAPKAILLYQEKYTKSVLHFWAFIAHVDSHDIKLIVIQREGGKKKFLSIMEDHYKNQNDPQK